MNNLFPFDSKSSDQKPESIARTVFSIAVLALAYYSTARLCLIFSLANTNVTPVWIPSGLAFAAIWILGYRVWPGIFIGAFSANVSAFFGNHFGDFWTVGIVSYAIAIGNTLEALAGCFFLRQMTRNSHPLNSVDDVLKFFFVAGVACWGNALFGPAAVCLSGQVSWELLSKMSLTWWLGDASGVLIIAPVLFVFHQFQKVEWKATRVVEALVLIGVLVSVNYGIFWQEFFVSKSYLLLPAVVWSAYRFGILGASVATLMTLGMAMSGTISGLGPFAHPDLNTSLMMLLAFVGIISVTGLVLAAAMKDRYWAIDRAELSEQRFRSLVENSADMVSIVSPDAKTLYASPATTRILGYTIEEYVGRNAFDFIHPQDTAQIMRILSQILANPGKNFYGGCRFRHKDGSWRWLEGSGTNLIFNPAVGGIVVNYRDVTEKKKAQEDQLYLSAIIENSDDAIYGKSLEGVILSWNRGAEKMYGYKQNEIVGQVVSALTPEERIPELRKVFEDLKQGKVVRLLETVRRRKDGQLINVSMRISPIKDDSGHLIGYSTIARDITERKKSESALRESEARFRKMADSAPVMLWMSGSNTLGTFFNKAWLDFTGRGLQEELGSGWTDTVHPDDVKRCQDIYLNAFDHREKFTMDFRMKRWDGEYRWVIDTGVPRYSGDNKFEGFVGSCLDITERKMAEEILRRDAENLKKTVEERSRQLDKMQGELKKANRLADIGTLAATVAHELRNPLGVIQMAAFNLKRRHPELAEERHLANIDKKVWEGERIINNLLTYASVKVPRYEELPVLKILDDCVKSIHSRFLDTEILVDRKYNVSADIVIHADQLQLSEVFNNILMNAFQAFPEKKGAIELSVAEHGQMLRVVVQDNGVGIDQEDMDKVFVPFFTRKAKGTGLGLAICNELVHLHNGKIDIASEKGKGTAVTVDFPIRQEAYHE